MRPIRNDRGIALLTVITALLALMVIAVPFAIAMRQSYQRGQENIARMRVKRQADSAMRFLEAFAIRTTDREEIRNRDAKSPVVNNDPYCDTPEEFTPTVQEMADALNVPAASLQDPNGMIVGWSIEDENAKLNLNTASFFALGNLLGLSALTEDLRESDRTITLEDASQFPPSGYVKIGRELAKYTRKSGNRLEGVERGLLASEARHGKPEPTYTKGQWVVNYAAWAIAHYPVARRPGEFTPFDGLDVSDINSLDPLDQAVPALTRSDWERVVPFVTCWSKGVLAEGWANAQAVDEGTSLPSDENDYDQVRVPNASYYNLGTVVRYSERTESNVEEQRNVGSKETLRPRRHDYAMIYDAVPSRNSGKLEFYGKAHRKFDGNRMRVEYRTRHPVNINTASREVLVALFANLRLLTTNPEQRVTRAEAELVADEILRLVKEKKALRSFEGFEKMLTDLEQKQGRIRSEAHQAIYRNALNSNDQGLVFGTAPICFRTYDVYTSRVSVSSHDAGGRQLARHAETRTVAIGSQVVGERTWQTQRDFEEQLVLSNNPRYWTTGWENTGSFRGPTVEPWPRWPKQLQQKIFAYDPWDGKRATDPAYRTTDARDTQAATNGDIRLAPARMEFESARAGALFVEHFDNDRYVEGNFAEGGYPLSLNHAIFQNATENGLPQPFAVQLWWKPQGATSGNLNIFDLAEDEFRNRYACYVDSGANQLVFAVSDNTQVQRACELRYDLSKQGGIVGDVWYHIHLIAAGCHPSLMQMLVDGRAVGEPNVLTILTGGLSADAGTVSVDNASGFPNEGALLVGTEVIEYTSRGSNSFTVRTDSQGNIAGRGRRGTVADDHGDGSAITLFGYSRPLTVELRKGGATLDSGSQSDLGAWSPVIIDNESGAQTQFASYQPSIATHFWEITPPGGGGGGGGGPPQNIRVDVWTIPFNDTTPISGVPFAVYPPGTTNTTVQDQLTAFQDDGFCLVLYVGGTKDDFDNFMSGGSDNVNGRVELMKYTKTSDTTLTLERSRDAFGSQTAPTLDNDYEILTGYQVSGAATVALGDVHIPIYIAPVSIRTSQTSAEEYLNPPAVDNMTHWLIQLLGPDGGNGNRPWEWVRYSELLQSGNFSYFIQARINGEEYMLDAAGVDDDAIVGALKIGGVPIGDSIDPGGGGTPGGDPPGGGGGGGGGGGDPPPAPPSDGGGGEGGTPPPSPDPGPAPEPDGGGGEGGTPPPSPDPGPAPEPDGGGGEGGTPPPTPDPGPAPEPDGGGGEGAPDPGHPADPAPEPDGGGGEGSEPPPFPPDDGGGGGGDDGGGPTEPPPTDPPPAGTGPNSPGDQNRTDDAGNGGAQKPKMGDPSTENWSNELRFRGVQDDRDGDGFVDDWWTPTIANGSAVVPVFATYGGRDPAQFVPGEDFSIWPRPGFPDLVDLVNADDETREGGALHAFWSMNHNDERVRSDGDHNQKGDTDIVAPGVFSHLVALDDHTNDNFQVTDGTKVKSDYRKYTRLLCFPSAEMPDHTSALRGPAISKRFTGEATSSVIDEITGDSREQKFGLTLLNETLGPSDETIRAISTEGLPNQGDVPAAPGVLKMGDELIVFQEAELAGDSLQFRGCRRGVLRTEPRSHERGTRLETLFNIHVGVLSDGVSESSNQLMGKGFDRFPRMGCVRLEDREAQQGEIRLYTENAEGSLRMPVNDTGAGIFTGRYGSGSRSYQSGTPVFWQPVRNWDRYADSSDDPELSFFSFSTDLTDAFVKRIYWKEVITAPFLNVRVFSRFNEGIEWNATEQRIRWRSRDGDSSGVTNQPDAAKGQAGENPLKLLYAFEDPMGDNLINFQADRIEMRMFVIFESGAYKWTDPAAIGWKSSPLVQSVSIEYVNQNRVRRHADE